HHHIHPRTIPRSWTLLGHGRLRAQDTLREPPLQTRLLKRTRTQPRFHSLFFRVHPTCTLPSRGPSMSSSASRGSTTFDVFRRGVSPVETELGESCEKGRRISWSSFFDIV